MLKLSVNRHHKDKKVAKKRYYSSGFTAQSLSGSGLAQIIKKGYAWSCATYRHDYRSIENFIQAETVGIDIDDGLTLSVALEHPFIKQYCLLIYTSPSHQKWKDGKPPCDRYRLIFHLPQSITHPLTYKHTVKLVGEAIGTYDRAATDAARYWCGNSQAHIISLNGEPLPLELIQQAEEKAKEEEIALEQARKEQQKLLDSVDPDLIKQTVKDILLTEKIIEPRRPGTGTYEESRNVVWAIASVFERDEAVAIAEVWSPPIKGWEPAKIIDADGKNRGKKSKRVTVLTLFKYATDKGYQLPFQLSKEKDLSQYLEKCRQEWQKSKQFTPDRVIDNQPWFEMEVPKEGTITCIRAGLGLGKTTQLRKWLKQDWKDSSAISLGYRNTLLLQFCADTDKDFFDDSSKQFKHLHRDNPEINWLSDTLRLLLCIESIEHLKPENLDNVILILDEAVSVIKTLLFSKTVRNRGKKIELFIEAVQRAKLVLCFDGNLSDMVCQFLASCDQGKKLIKVEAKNKGNKPPLKLLDGSLTETDILKDRDYSLWIYQLLNHSERPVVCSDSQILIEAIDNLFQTQGKDGLRVDSKTINSPEVRAFLDNPDQWIDENRPDYLLYSPSAESGLSVAIKDYFTHFYGFLFGVLDADSAIQMIARLRDLNLWRYLWVNPWTKQNDPDSIHSPLACVVEYHLKQRITRDINEVLRNNLDIASELLTYLQNNSYCEADLLSKRIQAMRNWEKSNFRECVYWMLEQSGYDISQRVVAGYSLLDATRKQLSREKKEVKRQNARDIFNACDKYLGKPHTLLNFDASWPDRCALIKAKLIDKLPDIHKTPFWSVDFIYTVLYDHPDLIYRLETRYLLLNPHQAQRKSQEIYHAQLLKGRKGEKLTPWTLKPQYLRIETLRKLGLLDFIQETLAQELTADSEPIQRLVNICQKKAIWQALGKKPQKDPIKYTRWLLNQIGYDFYQKTLKRDGKTVRVYQVICAPDNETGKLITPIMTAIAARYEGDKPILNWDEGKNTTSQFDTTENGTQNDELIFSPTDPPQTQSEQGVEEVTLSPIVLTESPGEVQPLADTTESQKTEDKYLENGFKLAARLGMNEGNPQIQLNWNQVINAIDKLIEGVGWSISQARSYIQEKYGKKSRLQLSDAQIIEFWAYLEQMTVI